MINKDKTLRDIYPCANDQAGTDRIHPAFMFEQLSMEGETPRRARVAPIWHFGLDFAVLSACSQRCQTGLPGVRSDTEDHRVEGEFPCNNL